MIAVDISYAYCTVRYVHTPLTPTPTRLPETLLHSRLHCQSTHLLLVLSIVPSFDWGRFVDMTEMRSIGTTQVYPRTLSTELELIVC